MKKFRAVQVGAGGMGHAWLRNLQSYADRVELVGLVDISEAALKRAQETFDIPAKKMGTDLSAMLDAVRPDFVVDVTIPPAHREVTVTALEAGYPVIGEKPLAPTLDDARAMIETSERTGVLYMVSQSRRYNRQAIAYAEALKSGAVGDLGILNVDFYMGVHFGGFRDEMESPLLVDMAIHTLDMARMLSGKDAVSVFCKEFNPYWSWYAGDVAATAIFEMEDGLVFTYRGCWAAEGMKTSWEGDWRAVGDKGTLIWDGTNAPHGEIVTGTEGFSRDLEPFEVEVTEGPQGIAGSLPEFLHCLETGEKPQSECHDNFKSLAMVISAVESSKKGEVVCVPKE
jgi:predicted dehydrogenase